MGLSDKLRSVAGLFVEMPLGEEGRAAPEKAEGKPAPATAGATSASDPATDDLDRRIAAMNEKIKQMNASVGGAAAPTTPTAAAPASAKVGGGDAKTIADIVRDSDGPNLDEINVSAGGEATPSFFGADGSIDFPALYQHANLPVAPFTAEQTIDMLASLPENLPLEVRRQTVAVTVGAMGKAIGATPDSIVADASRKLAALASFEQNFSKQAAEFVAAANFEIAELEKQMKEKREAITDAQTKQADVTRRCEAEADRLDDVLEFFSLDVAPSRHAATPPPLPPNAP